MYSKCLKFTTKSKTLKHLKHDQKTHIYMYEHDMYSFTHTFLPKRLLTFIHIIMT